MDKVNKNDIEKLRKAEFLIRYSSNNELLRSRNEIANVVSELIKKLNK